MPGRDLEAPSDATFSGQVMLENPQEHTNGGRSSRNPSWTSSFTRPEVRRERYPNCIVWTPIPVLTWIFPFVGIDTGVSLRLSLLSLFF